MPGLYWISQHSRVPHMFRFSLSQRIPQTLVEGTIREAVPVAEGPVQDPPVAVPEAAATVEAVPVAEGPVQNPPVAVPEAAATVEAVPVAEGPVEDLPVAVPEAAATVEAVPVAEGPV